MLFMVVETFRDKVAMQARFRAQGRLLPEGVIYKASWIDIDGKSCFQIMEAPDRAQLQVWIERWSDIIDFAVTEVLSSADYWARQKRP